jgi:hypothetical protein
MANGDPSWLCDRYPGAYSCFIPAMSGRSEEPRSGRPYLGSSVPDQASSSGSFGWGQPANELNTAADHGAHPSSVEGVLNLCQFLGIAKGQSAAASDRIGAEQQKTIRETPLGQG